MSRNEITPRAANAGVWAKRIKQMATPNDTPDTITIQLTQGQVTVIDAIDSDLCAFKWYANFNPQYANGGKYVVMRMTPDGKGNQKKVRLHRVIMERALGRALDRQEFVDHIDMNTLNNCRSNLRLATISQNAMNRGVASNNKTSPYKGISYHKQRGKWDARIMANGKRRYLGYFDTIEEAREAWIKAAKELHGDFAYIE